MTMTMTAIIPSRTIKWAGKSKTLPARTETFRQDERGRWYIEDSGTWEPVLQDEVIDICRKASNWLDIKRAHFALVDIGRTDSWI